MSRWNQSKSKFTLPLTSTGLHCRGEAGESERSPPRSQGKEGIPDNAFHYGGQSEVSHTLESFLLLFLFRRIHDRPHRQGSLRSA